MTLAKFNAPLRQCLRLATASEASTIARLSTARTSLPSRTTTQSLRSFTTSPALHKKRKIASPQPELSSNDGPPEDPRAPQPDPQNPLDFGALIAAFTPIDSHFKSQLQGLTNGGRFNPDHIGSIPVTVKTSEAESDSTIKTTATFPLNELAQVVPRSGRAISLLVNDKAYIKPIMSTIQAHKDFNQQPQKSEDNDLELLLKVEIERKEDMVRRAKDVTQKWRERIRHARNKHEKVMQKWKKDGTVTSDMTRKAERDLQALQDKKMKEIDVDEQRVVRQLERNH